MDKMEFTRGNLQEEPPKRIKKKSHRRWLYLALAVGAVLLIVLCAVLWDSTAFDGLRRDVIYAKAEKDENGCALLYRYAAEKDQRCAYLDGSLVLASQHSISVISEGGQELYQADIKFHKCAVTQKNGTAAVYDIGGREIYLLDRRGLLRRMETGGEILSCSLSEGGELTVTTGGNGYKAVVSVYDQDGVLRFEYKSSDRFLMTAITSRSGRQMAAVTMGQAEGVFSSSVVFYRTDSEEMQADCMLPGGAVYDLGVTGGNYCAVAENGLFFIGKDGTQQAFFDFEGAFLRRCSLRGNGYAAVVLGQYKTGGGTTLVTVSDRGEVLGRAEIEGEVLSVDSAGKYVAVLCSDSLTIYDKKMNLCSELKDVSAARTVLMRPDGSALLVGAESASLYLP